MAYELRNRLQGRIAHLDETTIHVHEQTLPATRTRTSGRAPGSGFGPANGRTKKPPCRDVLLPCRSDEAEVAPLGTDVIGDDAEFPRGTE